jgi:hypothetical protein
LSFNALVIFLLAYRPHGLLEEIVEYDSATIKDALHELGVGYFCASGTTTWYENGHQFSATYRIRELPLEGETEEYEYQIWYNVVF